MTAQPQIQGTLDHAARSLIEPIHGARDSARLAKNISTKSPLRYPGGKSRAVRKITQWFPADLTTLASPFFGGGSVELACASQGIEVYGYDVFEPLVDFWQIAIEDSVNLATKVYEYHPLTRTKFYALQKRYFTLSDRVQRAAAFFALNRSSYSGTTLSGGMSPGHPRFTESSIQRLAELSIDNLSVEHADFKDSISAHDDDFLYLDPPYANGGTLYGNRGDLHKEFDHYGLADILHSRDQWILSYNDCPLVRDLYSEYKLITPEWTYGMSNRKSSNEALILSKDLVELL